MKRRSNLKSTYFLPLLIVILFLLILIMLYQMHFSVSKFIAEQASVDNIAINEEKAHVFSLLLDKLILSTENLLEYSKLSFLTAENEFYAREYINDYYNESSFVRFYYHMKDGRIYNHESRPYTKVEARLTTLIQSGELGFSDPFYDADARSELIIVYMPADNSSDIGGVAAYFLVSDLYSSGEFYESDKGSYYIMDRSGSTIFEKDKNKESLGVNTVSNLMLSYNFTQAEIDLLYSDLEEDVQFVDISKFNDDAAISIQSVPGFERWLAVSILRSDYLSDKSDSVLKQSLAISVFIMATFIVFTIIFVTSDAASIRRMERMQNLDPVTGSSNQYRFEIDAAELIRVNKNTNYALLFISIENLKGLKQVMSLVNVNNIIRGITDILKKEIAYKLESFGRNTENGIMVLMKYKERHEIEERFLEILEKVKEIRTSVGYSVRLKAGVYYVDRASNYTASEMIDRAEFALDSIREDSPQLIEFYHQKSHDDLLKTIMLEGFMEKALENEEFVIYYQPKYDLLRSRIHGAEALVRWIRPNEGIVPPSQFINLFEKSGYISQLDRFVFEEVCRFQHNLMRQGQRIIPISINVSRATTEVEGYLDFYIETKKRYNIKDGFLELEFTESRALENYDTLAARISQLKKNGFICSIDDFGAGYSSFKALQELDFDVMKLDSTFLKFKGRDPSKNIKLLAGIVSLAKSLNMKVVAEGVETQAELAMLKEIKCDIIQGYLYSRALKKSDYILFVEKALTSSTLPIEEGKEDAQDNSGE